MHGILRGEAVDARADLFSLGIILYELATGRRPFTGETSIDVSHAILRDAPGPLSRVRTDLPGGLVSLIDHCLQKSPRERVQTVLDVNNALRRLRKALERGVPEKLRDSRSPDGDRSAFQVAEVRAFRGERDAAFEWLERALEGWDAGIALLKVSPRLRAAW